MEKKRTFIGRLKYIKRKNAKVKNIVNLIVVGDLPERWQPCGQGENICNCKNASECGYIQFYAGIARLYAKGNFC